MPIKFDTETFDYGRELGVVVLVTEPDGKVVMRNAMQTSLYKTIRPPVWAPPEKVYIKSLDELRATIVIPSYDDDEPEAKVDYRVTLDKDEGGYFYTLPARMISPGREESVDTFQVYEEAKDTLKEWLKTVQRAGELIKEAGL